MSKVKRKKYKIKYIIRCRMGSLFKFDCRFFIIKLQKFLCVNLFLIKESDAKFAPKYAQN